MYITREMLENFENKYADENDSLPLQCCKAAEETVEKYLGYCPEEKEYTFKVYGNNSEILTLPVWIMNVISVDGETGLEWDIEKNHLFYEGRKKKWHSALSYEVKCKGGFTEVPLKIVTVALQLASLYWESAGGNLAVSSTSYADTGTRVFNNFSEDRFLKDIDAWRIYK